MECSQLLKEALDGIDFTYRADTVLDVIASDKPMPKQRLLNLLKKHGVTDDEIKARGIEEFYDDVRIYKGGDVSPSELKARLGVEDTKMTKQDFGTRYEHTTYKGEGVDNPTYKETGFTVPGEDLMYKPHYQMTGPDKDIIGWNRTHQGDFNGEKVLYLNEFQSDWAQAERAGRGIFEKNMGDNAPKMWIEADEGYQKVIKYFDDNMGMIKEEVLLEARRKGSRYNESRDQMEINPKELQDALGDDIYRDLFNEAGMEAWLPNTIPDFPMKEKKFHQMMIVDAIDNAMKNGLKKIVIPIERQKNQLAGTEGVTKFYDSLDTGILPKIRKQLEKQGLMIKTSKEEMNSVDKFQVIEILEKPGKKVKWEVYSLLGALGLTEEYERTKNAEQ